MRTNHAEAMSAVSSVDPAVAPLIHPRALKKAKVYPAATIGLCTQKMTEMPTWRNPLNHPAAGWMISDSQA